MNLSDVVNDIVMTQGLSNIAVPFKEPIETVIQEILATTAREYSAFKPYEQEAYASKKNLRSPSEMAAKANIFLLPPEVTRTKVISAKAEAVSNEYQNAEATTNAFTVGTPFVGFGSYYPQDIIDATATGAAINKFAGVTSQLPVSTYLGFNKIQLFNFPDKCLIKFTVSREHDPSLMTIPDTCYISFMKLATLDVQRTLYAKMKNINNVGSAYKEIMLKIEDWAGAQKEQETLLDDWTGKFHLDKTKDLVQFF